MKDLDTSGVIRQKQRDRRWPRAFSSGAFRFALVLTAVFVLGSALLLWAVERQVNRYATETTNAMLHSEATALADEYRGEGLTGLIDAINYRSRASRSPYHFVLVRAGHKLTGDLPVGVGVPGWQTRTENLGSESHSNQQRTGQQRTGSKPMGASAEAMRHYGIRLPDGLILVVATDTFDIEEMGKHLERFTLFSAAAIILFAMLGGLLAGQMFLGRLERINAAVARIIAGSSTERLPLIGVAPEFDQLTRNLNRMIDRQFAASEGLKQVSAAIAHELRTPLARLKQRLEAMRDDAEKSEGASNAAIDDCVSQIDAILATFQSLLRIAMLEGGAGRRRLVDVDLAEVIERVTLAYQPVAEDAGYVLTRTDLPCKAVMVHGDGELLAQLLANLIENALQHTPAGTHITIDLHTKSTALCDKALLTVFDNGPGVLPDERDQLFRKFYRASGHGASGSGVGLGLALVAAIAELHEAEYRIVPDTSGFALELTFSLVRPLNVESR